MENNIIINKNVCKKENYKTNLFYYQKARVAFFHLLKELQKKENFCIYLPAYIGYSPNEGSGIDDPIEELHYQKKFYKMDSELHIDIDDLKRKLTENNDKKILFLVHYYGYVDPKIEEIVTFARKNDILIIEDCAHAFYTDFVNHQCGHYGDYAIYSLHKMFPLESGGMLKVNTNLYHLELNSTEQYNLLEYDFQAISDYRMQNAELIYNQLKDCPYITLLRHSGINTPQTYPILIDKRIKEKVYFKMNEEGYQIVALYFRMIPQIEEVEYPISYKISKEILNLPVHQDATKEDIIEMCKVLKECVSMYANEL